MKWKSVFRLVAVVPLLMSSVSAHATVNIGACDGNNPWSESAATCPSQGTLTLCDQSPSDSTLLQCYISSVCSSGTKAWLVKNPHASKNGESYVFYAECDSTEVYCCDIHDDGSQELFTVGIEGTSSSDWLFLQHDPPSGSNIQLAPVSGFSSVAGFLHGNGGNDYLTASAASNTVDTLEGGSGNDDLRGYDAVETLSGGVDDDFCLGGDDNDILNGDAGEDKLVGYKGGDTIHGGDNDDDRICGADMTSFSGPADLFSFPTGDPGAYTLTCYDLALGSDADFLFGDDGNDQIWGHRGMDRLEGGDGDDILRGGNQDDVILTGAGVDEAYGEGDEDTICTENAQNSDVIDGGSEDDTLFHSDPFNSGSVNGGTDVTDDTCYPYPDIATSNCELALSPASCP